jgi:alpha-L-rhamnosidase
MRRLAVVQIAVAAVALTGALIGLGWWLAAADTDSPPQPAEVVDLRTEHARNPIGVEHDSPRLAWRLRSDRQGATQTALRVRVASDPALLSDDEVDVWDSGVVESETPWIDYDGPALAPATRFYWQVRIVDDSGRATAWSDVAFWETALDEDAWAGEWIGAPFERLPLETGNPHWDGAPEPLEATGGTYGQAFSAAVPFERVDARLTTADDATAEATLALHAGDADGPVLASARHAVAGGEWVVLELDEPAPPGDYALVLAEPDGPVSWSSHTRARYDGGHALVDGVATDGDRAFRVRTAGAEERQALPLLRQEFELPEREILRARLYVSALGTGEVHLNGERVGDQVLDPGFTDYRRTVLYATHDVAGFLRPGANAVGVALGSGWFGVNTPTAVGFHLAPWHGEPQLRLQLAVEYADGAEEVIVTSTDWRAAEAPTRADSVYGAEVYDARRHQPGWTEPGFDDGAWEQAVERPAPGGRPRAQPMEPVRVVDTVEAAAVEQVAPGVHVFDFGRTMAGWASLRVRGAEGTEVRVTYGDRLDDDGRVTAGSDLLERPLQSDRYILRGDAEEIWEPAFSTKGFRYVELEGYPGTPGADDLQGRTAHAEVAPAGRFESSDELLTRIHESTRRAIAGNLQSTFTADMAYDRHPWTGPVQLSASTALHQFGLERFLGKWLDDLADAQRADGALPRLAPATDEAFDAPSPAWDGAYLLVAWDLYQHTGDERVLSRHYEGFTAYLDYLAEHADGGLIRSGIGDVHAPRGPDGPAAPEAAAFVSTAYYAHLAFRLSAIAERIGEDADAQRYWSLAEEIRAAFNAEFFDAAAGVYRTAPEEPPRQTAQVLPLAFELVPDGREREVLGALVDDLAARDARLDTGIVGSRFLLPVLSQHGAVDLAYRVASQTDYPSWGHWIEAGVTGMPDRWDLDVPSHGHHVLASVGTWLYEDLAGIRPREPGYERVLVRPRIPTGLPGVRAAVLTPHGTLGTAWEQDGEQLRLRISVPPGTSAEVHVPAARRGDVRESGQGIWRNPDVAFDRMEHGAAVFEAEAGVYEFVADLD